MADAAPHEEGNDAIRGVADARRRDGNGAKVLPAPLAAVGLYVVRGVDSWRARVPKTRCRWQVLIAYIVPSAERKSVDEEPVAEDTSDPTSRLTQAAMTAVNAIFRARCASALLPITYIDAVPLSLRNVSNLLPGKWMNDEVMNGYTTLLQRRHAETRKDNPATPRMHFFCRFMFAQLYHRGK